jgi:hypothetical protein
LNDLDLYLWYVDFARKPGSYDLDALLAVKRDTAVVPDPERIAVAFDKHWSYLTLARAGVPVPDSMLVSQRNLDAAAPVIEEWRHAVLKPRRGCFGWGVLFIDNFTTLRDVVGYIDSETTEGRVRGVGGDRAPCRQPPPAGGGTAGELGGRATAGGRQPRTGWRHRHAARLHQQGPDLPRDLPAARRARRATAVTAAHVLAVDESLAATGTDPDRGLSLSEARVRLVGDGPNELPSPKRRGAVVRVAGRINHPLICILLASASDAGGGRLRSFDAGLRGSACRSCPGTGRQTCA